MSTRQHCVNAVWGSGGDKHNDSFFTNKASNNDKKIPLLNTKGETINFIHNGMNDEVFLFSAPAHLISFVSLSG